MACICHATGDGFLTLFDAGLLDNISVVGAEHVRSPRLRRQPGREEANSASSPGSSTRILSDIASVARGNGAVALAYGAFGVHSVFQTGRSIAGCLLMSEPAVDTIEISSFMSDHEAKLKRPCE